MTKKYLFSLLIEATSLTACGSDDDPVVSGLNRLTKVSCYEDGASSPLSTTDVNYTSDSETSDMNLGVDRLLFIYSDGKFSVTGIHSGEAMEEYTLSGNVIISKKISQENPYASNEIYVSDEYPYRYSGPNWVLTSWSARWLKELGIGCKERSYPKRERYTWGNGNVVLYVQLLGSREMRYEYNAAGAPKNFPLQVIGSFSPAGFGSVTPLNLLYDVQDRNLSIRACIYTTPNQNEVKVEYKYTYTIVGDCITGMTIDENDGGTASSYRYTLEYNFTVK